MLSVFHCLAHWSLCLPPNGRSTVLKRVAQQVRSIEVLLPEQLLELLDAFRAQTSMNHNEFWRLFVGNGLELRVDVRPSRRKRLC